MNTPFSTSILSILLAVATSATLYAGTDSLKKGIAYQPSGNGFSFGAGAVFGIPIGDLSSMLKSNAGYQIHLAWLIKRFAIEGCVSGMFSTTNTNFTLGAEKIPLHSPVELYSVGIQVSYSLLYTDLWRVSPLLGPGWSALTYKDNNRTGNRLTGVAGVKVEYNILGRTNLGGLRDGFVLPLYFKYSFSMPVELARDIRGGAHFFSAGVECYLKEGD